MLIYFTVLFIVVASAYISGKKELNALESKMFLSIAFIAMIFVAGLRNETVGTDTYVYVRKFEDMQNISDVIRIGGDTFEFGFWILTWFVRSIFNQYAMLFIVVAIIVVGCYFKSIIKYSNNITISFFILITMGFYTFFFNGARQGVACAIYALAIGPLLERNFKSYLGYVLLAVIFHKTAIMMLPIYFALGEHNSFKKNIIIMMIGVGVAIMFQRIVEISVQIDKRYIGNAEVTKGSGYFMMGLTIVLYLFFVYFKKYVHIERNKYLFFLNMFMIGTVISAVSAIIAVNPSGFLRFTLYFNVSAVFLWPLVYINIINKSSKLLFSYLLATCYLVLFFLTTERFSNLIPYTVNPYFLTLSLLGG